MFEVVDGVVDERCEKDVFEYLGVLWQCSKSGDGLVMVGASSRNVQGAFEGLCWARSVALLCRVSRD